MTMAEESLKRPSLFESRCLCLHKQLTKLSVKTMTMAEDLRCLKAVVCVFTNNLKLSVKTMTMAEELRKPLFVSHKQLTKLSVKTMTTAEELRKPLFVSSQTTHEIVSEDNG